MLPGYFWACFLRRTDGLAERLTYSTALSLATVPALALALARILHTGISLTVAIATVLLVAAPARWPARSGGPRPPAGRCSRPRCPGWARSATAGRWR